MVGDAVSNIDAVSQAMRSTSVQHPHLPRQPVQLLERRSSEVSEVDRTQALAPEPTQFDRLIAVGSLHAAEHSSLEYGCHVRSLVAIRISKAKSGASKHCHETGRLDNEPGFFLSFTNDRIFWSFVDLDRATDESPEAGVCVSDEHHSTQIVLDQDAHRRQQEQFRADQVTNSSHMI